MQTSTHPPYAQLQQRLDEWKAAGHVSPPGEPPHHAFLLAVEKTLLPELTKLAHILNEAGLHCDVLRGDDDEPAVGLCVKTFQAVLRLSPDANPTRIRVMVARDNRPNDTLEWCIPYRLIRTGGLERELQAAMMHLLVSSKATLR